MASLLLHRGLVIAFVAPDPGGGEIYLLTMLAVLSLMVYALGRRLEAEDMPTVRSIVRAAAKDDYRFSTIVLGIVRSPQFQQKARFSPSATQAVAENRTVANASGVSN